MKTFCVLLFLSISCDAAPICLTGLDGRTITATVTGTDGGDVVIKRADGKPFRIPLAKLNEASKAAVKAEMVALPLIDVASVLGEPDTAALDLFGKPYQTTENYKSWSKDGWDWTAKFENGASVLMNIDGIPKDKSPKTLAEAAALFGFTKANGWFVGEEFKKGA